MTEQTTHFAGDLDTSLEAWELPLPEDEAGCALAICSNSAAWRLLVSPCGCSWLHCTPHHDSSQATLSASTSVTCCCKTPHVTTNYIPV